MAKKKLTAKQKREYIANPNYCPYCHEEDLDIYNKDTDENYIRHHVQCTNCKQAWVETYILTSVQASRKTSSCN